MPVTFLPPVLRFVFCLLFWQCWLQQKRRSQNNQDVSSLPRTGSAEGQTTSITNGIKMALEEADYKVGDFKIVVRRLERCHFYRAATGIPLPRSTTPIWQRATVTAWSISVPFNSGAAKASMPILNQAGLLMISPGKYGDCITKPSG